MAHIGTAALPPLVGASVTLWANVVVVGRPSGEARIGHGGPRGEVHGFSAASRRRLLRLLAECQTAPQWFCTLTYPAEYPDVGAAKAQLKAFLRRLARNLEAHGVALCALWRLERQQRGAPHFHLLLWLSKLRGGLPPVWRTDRTVGDACAAFRSSRDWPAESLSGAAGTWRAMVTYLSGAWFHAAGRLSADHLNIGTDVAQVKSRRAVVAYVSKYVGKEDVHAWVDQGTGEILRTGRTWGVSGNEALQDRRPVAHYHVAEGDGCVNTLAELWDHLGNSWGAGAERQGWSSYSVFVTDEGRSKAAQFLSERLDVSRRSPGGTLDER